MIPTNDRSGKPGPFAVRPRTTSPAADNLPSDDPSVVAFAALVLARKAGDLRKCRDYLRSLKALGWMIGCTLPRETRGGRP